MKRINIIMALFLIAILCSCESYLDTHKEFIKDGGETIYLQKVDSCVSRTGMDRVELELWYENAHNLTNTIIYYNDKADSIVLSLDGMKPGKDVKIEVLDLPEGNYNLEIVNRNKYGQSSLATDYFVSTYGANYLTRIENRAVKKSAYTEPGIFNVSWYSVPDNYLFLELKYTDKKSGEKIIRVEEDIETIIEGDADAFTYRTAYAPESGAIDIFYTEWSKDIAIAYPDYFVISKEDWEEREHDGFPSLDRSGWLATANTQSPEAGVGGCAEHIVDNNTVTSWHSKWEGGTDPLPYIITIDMLENKSITSLELSRRTDNKQLKDVSFLISADGENWTNIGELNFPFDIDPNSKVLLYNKEISGRYLEIRVTSSHENQAASIRELYVTGVN